MKNSGIRNSYINQANLTCNPDVAKAGELHSQDAEGEAVVNLLRTLGNAGYEVHRLSQRVNKMVSIDIHPLNSILIEIKDVMFSQGFRLIIYEFNTFTILFMQFQD